ncbi:MAG: serine hydrolase [Verrucomicrobia bacterium]|nr:serine hydrolase [Verrucomicrobiota bacterium]
MLRIFLLSVTSLFLMNIASAQPEHISVLRDKTQKALNDLAGKSGGVMGFCVLDLTDGTRFALNEKLVFPQASAIKIAILMEVYKQAGEGKFKLTDIRPIRKEDKAGGSGILNDLGNDTVQMSIRDLCVLMMVLSDNSATNMLIDLVGHANINATMESLGLRETRVRRRMMDTGASHRGDENTSTPTEAVRVMELLHTGKFLNRAACKDMISILKKGKTTSLGEGLPKEVVIASKPGGITGVKTEWAIIEVKNRPYAVAVMENYGMGDAAETFKEISRTLHDYFSRLGEATSHGALVKKPK